MSFEMVRVLMAIENIIIPFDNRFFIDYKSLPYIALKIDEIQHYMMAQTVELIIHLQNYYLIKTIQIQSLLIQKNQMELQIFLGNTVDN